MDIASILASLQGSALAGRIRDSLLLFPLLESAHVIGLALVFGTIAVIDLRLDTVHSRLLAATQGRGFWKIDIWLPGDINGDGVANVTDITMFVNVLLGLNTDPATVARCDLNADGVVDANDIQPFVDRLVP